MKREHGIDITLESFVHVMQLFERGNDGRRSLHVSLPSDMDKSGNVRCTQVVVEQSSYEEGRDIQCDLRNGKIMKKAAGFMKVVLYALLDTVQAALHGITWSGRGLTHLKYADLGVKPGTGSRAQDGLPWMDFCRGQA